MQPSSEENSLIGGTDLSSVLYVEDSIEENARTQNSNSQKENCQSPTIEKFKDIVKNSPQLTDDDKTKIIASNVMKKKTLVSPQENDSIDEKQNSMYQDYEKMKQLTTTPIRKRLCLEKIKKESPDDEFISPDKDFGASRKTTSPKKNHSPRKELKGPDVRVNMKPLGFDKELQNWIQNIKNNPVISETPVS